MKTIYVIVMDLGERIFRNSVETILKKNLRLEHRQTRNTMMVKKWRTCSLSLEELNWFSQTKLNLRENILTQKMGVKSVEEK